MFQEKLSGQTSFSKFSPPKMEREQRPANTHAKDEPEGRDEGGDEEARTAANSIPPAQGVGADAAGATSGGATTDPEPRFDLADALGRVPELPVATTLLAVSGRPGIAAPLPRDRQLTSPLGRPLEATVSELTQLLELQLQIAAEETELAKNLAEDPLAGGRAVREAVQAATAAVDEAKSLALEAGRSGIVNHSRNLSERATQARGTVRELTRRIARIEPPEAERVPGAQAPAPPPVWKQDIEMPIWTGKVEDYPGWKAQVDNYFRVTGAGDLDRQLLMLR